VVDWCTVEVEQIRYARNDGVSLAYQAWGNGPLTILGIPPMAQNIELTWERPEFRHIYERLGSFAHVVHFDKRGTGVSDRTSGVPTLDQRVDDTRSVMDAAGIEQAVLMGLSEGGPMAMLLAVTYPERVQALVLVTTAASFVPTDESEPGRAARIAWGRRWVENWGTDKSTTLEVFAPSAANDAGYREWQSRYERHSATPAAISELLGMIYDIDVRPILGQIAIPTLIIHRRDDPVIRAEQARELATMIPGAQFVEVPGRDHFPNVGDTDVWLDAIEHFVTGTIAERPAATVAAVGVPEIRTMGGFGVWVGDDEVPLSAWGSRRARQLCKRLAVALGQPVTRDELGEVLWPGDDIERLPARLSVQLSAVRRILGGGIVADRAAVRLDLRAVRLDLDTLHRALAAGDDQHAVDAYRGELLPEDAYEEWTSGPRTRLRDLMIGAHRRLAITASGAGGQDAAAEHLARLLDLDPYDEWAHEQRTCALVAARRHGEAQRAEERYRAAMAELGVRPRALLTAVPASEDRSAV
jgi:pimeloyl-ACP methyl ester carboxylesterase/DNA-binding SARP family transcriptional activator